MDTPSTPLSIGYIDVSKLRLMTVAAAAQAVVLVAALSFVFATYLNQFVLYLTRLLGRVASGDLTAKMTMASTDEIGALSTDFNRVTRSLRNARGQLESYATSLEEKVQIRTEQLNATLSEVRTVKEKQDGDYYLTSLLLKPFLRAGLQTHSVEAAALISQFKKFEFRHFKEQIGGDSVTLDHVRLQERDYVFFMNSDAMGKSMQGVGGALVLGAVMHAYLQRTKVSRQAHDVFPESWLNRLRRNCREFSRVSKGP
ncbi:MAG TPA: methyl-accepting chemotaxis protein [Leptospiraceae bacterium]|nr:methyl-accepting chemotaxis protein [Leptospirales bacterium]HMU85192.1 methyl-accepting chemotaxis protein [Leptospiraceae bacterium]HMX55803.1 methyl-accepting chemotaxis protein [Leptospiraceae bacterium]HMY45610.1 methyl-accepting chemotaxis protein [Leptospiraceae bacterium]HNE22740.1 methyl-accepting chemotaxis protein [Leptospiraceae bacterium]